MDPQAGPRTWMKVHQKRLLDKGKIEKLVSVLRSIATANPQLAEKIRTEADYFTLKEMRSGYVIPGFVANTCLLARG